MGPGAGSLSRTGWLWGASDWRQNGREVCAPRPVGGSGHAEGLTRPPGPAWRDLTVSLIPSL